MRASGLIGPALLLSVAVAGCARMPGAESHGQLSAAPATSGAAELTYLARALEAPPGDLEKMLRTARIDHSISGKLHRALIISIPGSKLYDPSAATADLRALQHQQAGTDVGAVARVRLAEMNLEANCEERVKKIVNIEKKLDGSHP